ncbi:MAG: thioredoxin domain-containing protein [Candidatus Dojkabacteria bacterium]|nr:thioredoxin domain-containing protein [Candidatus Dojkabacteria bacterium]
MPKKSEKQSNDEIVISLDQFAIPGAIILAGVIIAITIFFTNKNKDNSVDDSSTDTVAGEETDTTTDSEFDSASVEIGDSPVLGDSDTATVAVVQFSEYLCSYCLRHSEETLPSIISDYVDTGEIIYVFKDFPIYGEDAANAAKCVYHLGGVDAYEEFHLGAFSYESDDDLYALAKEVGINESDFDACYSAREYQDEVDADYEAATNVGLQGTPGFVVGTIEDGVVNGVFIPGAYPYETFQSVIDGFLSE